jgi:glycosyltransferase involved in cell wall biosynthesis
MRVTILTPSFNQALFLRPAIYSVLEQQGDFELNLIVIDGGSTDGTVDLLQSSQDTRLNWTTGPDRGQADAINRGLQAADGDIIGWLNSDDLYLPGALATVARAFANPQTQWLAGRCQIINETGNVIRSAIAAYKDRRLARYSYRKLLRENFIAQPAVFWRRSLSQQVGPLDESLHYTMDYDLWLRLGRIADPLIVDQVLAQFRLHSASKSGKLNRAQFDEGFAVASRYFDANASDRFAHRFNVEKIVWSYRIMRLLGQ